MVSAWRLTYIPKRCYPIKKLFIIIRHVWHNFCVMELSWWEHAPVQATSFFPSLLVPKQLLPWLDSAARERHSSLLKIMYLFSHAYLITGICFCRWRFSSFYFCPWVNIWLFCFCKCFKLQFSGVRNWPDSVAGLTLHRAEPPPFPFLSEDEKRRLCINHAKPLRSPQPKLQDKSILFSLIKLFFF